ncbi:hypothetical protein J2Y54_000590 [Sphingomonas sp. BE123]|uniref:hypothetical protein n=1 Tax=Sphingomonas sp. BE123 TaxID=2817842 RepID=UPI00285A8311|nr:hypothetical protein [Sphingomonas sp. BE123]MDR6851097.1 hypothetical protein [Sphingomonas sp. BE123]
MLDITTKAVAATAAIHLKDAEGNHMYFGEGDARKPVQIVVYGPGSAQYAEVEARQTNRAVKRMQDNDGKVAVASPEQRDAEQAEDLAAITVSFENFTYPPAGTAAGAEMFRAFYADKSLGFITAQVLKAVRDWGNFKVASPPN